jgi:hypothetical protein
VPAIQKKKKKLFVKPIQSNHQFEKRKRKEKQALHKTKNGNEKLFHWKKKKIRYSHALFQICRVYAFLLIRVKGKLETSDN